jgi:uncharacterized protein involved in type VI secretion and phage assembly
MISGMVVGVVKDNVDPEKLNRILIELPTESTKGATETYWCRMISPMAGKNRGWVSIPEIGTEVVITFAYRSLTPYVIGAVYNGGDDKPEPYKNDDEKNNLRVFWSRNDHMIIFDDTEGEEKVELGAQAETRLDVTSAPIYQQLDSSQKTITEYSDGNIEWEAKETISIKCKDFILEASGKVEMKSGATTAIKSGGNHAASAGANAVNKGATIHGNSGYSASPDPVLELPEYKHPPTKPE